MSTDNITAFFAKAENEPELAARIEAVEGLPAAEKIAALIKLAAEYGMGFSAEDLKSLSSTDISDEELADVAGGGFAQVQGNAWEKIRRMKDVLQDTPGSISNISNS